MRGEFFALRSFWRQSPTALRIGLTASILWMLLFAGYVYHRWDKIAGLEPNNLGDFVAGAFAPLAFLWLAVAVFLQKDELGLQREELKQSRRALELQAEELRRSVEQFTAQTQIFREERASAALADVERRLNVDIDSIAREMMHVSEHAHVWYGPPERPNSINVLGHRSNFQKLVTQDDFDGVFDHAHHELSRSLHELKGARSELAKTGRFRDKFQAWIGDIERVRSKAVEAGAHSVLMRHRTLRLELIGRQLAEWLAAIGPVREEAS